MHPNDGQQLSPGFALDGASSVQGGETEECYTNVNPPGPGPNGTTWQALENTEIAQMSRNKTWFCSSDMAAGGTPDASQLIPERIYEFASFMLTYKHQLAYYHEGFTTASGFRQNVEEQLVALHPAAGEPSSVTALQVNGTYYARKYNACYIAGNLIGPCEFVVNSDKNATYALDGAGYTNTLLVKGSDIFDGGTVSASGPAAPTTIAPLTAYVLTKPS